jgi:hypothetical protein
MIPPAARTRSRRWMGIYHGAGIHGDGRFRLARNRGVARLHPDVDPEVTEFYDKVPVETPGLRRISIPGSALLSSGSAPIDSALLRIAQVVWLRGILRRQRHRLIVVAVIAVLGLVVAAEHSGIQNGSMGEVVSMCLAILDAVLMAVGIGVLVKRLRPRPPRWIRFALNVPRRPPRSLPRRSRAGPVALQVLLR